MGAGAPGTAAPAWAGLLAATPWPLLGVLGGSVLIATVLDATGVASRAVLRGTAITAGHGAMLATALAWADERGGGPGPRARLVTVALIALGAAGAALHPLGVLAYLGLPLWLIVLAREGRLTGLGLGPSVPAAGLALGVLLGLGLGAHLLVCAALTLGYSPFAEGLTPVLRELAYDVGAQVPATEAFFRGALFNHAQRRWPFAAACAVATGASVVRYLVDPLLPPGAELVAGAAFYTGLVGIASAWLLWRFGSLVPGLIAASLVFASYRALTA